MDRAREAVQDWSALAPPVPVASAPVSSATASRLAARTRGYQCYGQDQAGYKGDYSDNGKPIGDGLCSPESGGVANSPANDAANDYATAQPKERVPQVSLYWPQPSPGQQPPSQAW